MIGIQFLGPESLPRCRIPRRCLPSRRSWYIIFLNIKLYVCWEPIWHKLGASGHSRVQVRHTAVLLQPTLHPAYVARSLSLCWVRARFARVQMSLCMAFLSFFSCCPRTQRSTSWSNWTKNCPSDEISNGEWVIQMQSSAILRRYTRRYPHDIPHGTAVPGWAYIPMIVGSIVLSPWPLS